MQLKFNPLAARKDWDQAYFSRKLDDLVEVPKGVDGTEGSGDLAETDAVLITEISSRAQVNILTAQG